MKIQILIIAGVFSVLLSACHLLHPVTPEPASKIRQMHRLSGDYPSPKEMRANKRRYKKYKKQQEKLAKQRAADTLATDETDASLDDPDAASNDVEQADSDNAVVEDAASDSPDEKGKRRKNKKNKDAEVTADVEIDPETGEPIEGKKKKKKRKKRKKKGKGEDEALSATAEEEMRDNQQLIQEGEFQGDEEEISEKDIKREVRNADKAQRKELKAAEREAKKQAKADDRANVYRSRVTPWWRLNQNPKIGQQWRKPRQK